MKHPLVRFAVTALVSLTALYFAFRGVKYDDLMAELAHTNVLLILLGVLILFCAHLCRAWRWTVILRPIKKGTSVWGAFRAIMAGYGMNNIIPRSGELIRPFIFAKNEKLFMSGAVATIMIERVVDLISNLVAMLLVFVVYPTQIAYGFPAIEAARTPVVIGIVLVLMLVGVMFFRTAATESAIHRLIRKWPSRMRIPIQRAATEFATGLEGVRASGSVAVTLSTLGIWVFYVGSMYLWLYAFPEPQFALIGILGAFFLRVVSGLAFLIPTPGGVGSYHYFISQSLFRVFGVPLTAGIAYATVTNAAFNSITTIIGLTVLAVEGISFRSFVTGGIAAKEEGLQHAHARAATVDAPLQ